MTKTTHHAIPADGLNGLVQNWRNDFIAAISVSLVALPLGLGVAIASGAPPMSGIIASIVGGIVTTLFRGSYVGINGPAAGLIAVILAAGISLDDGSGRGLNYVLAAIAVSGAIQVLLGIFRLGRMAEAIPSSVIQGILAAIGVIIFAKQMHVAMGTSSDASSTMGILMDIPKQLPDLNPFVAIISIASILLLLYHARISYKLFHFLPAPMWVLVLALPFVYYFNFFEAHTLSFLDRDYSIGPEFLISIPDNPLDAIMFPDFSKIGTLDFWLAVISITLIATIASLASAKAVDKLDPYRRKTDLNKDLVGVGLGTLASACIGGLTVTTVIIRSSVNVNNNAKTRWSNMYHGLLLLIFVLVLGSVIQKVPLAALAAILVVTGYKLASPRVLKAAYNQGVEQLLFLTGTLIITLYTNLLWGIVGGIILTLLVHILLARVPIREFFKMVYSSGTKMNVSSDGSFDLKIKGIANFLSIMKYNKMLERIPEGTNVNINLKEVTLVDLTVLESFIAFKHSQEETGGKVELGGMEHHVASTNHPLALKSRQISVPRRLSPRERRLKKMAARHKWTYRREVDWDTSYLRHFQFFETRPIERKFNVINGVFPDGNIKWEISDITFDEGALVATEVYHTTVEVLRLPFKIPPFIMEEEGFFDRIFDKVMAMTGQKDIDFQQFANFSDKFLLKGENEDIIRKFFKPELLRFFENEDIYHIESNGEALLIFKYLRRARVDEMNRMLDFSKQLLDKVRK